MLSSIMRKDKVDEVLERNGGRVGYGKGVLRIWYVSRDLNEVREKIMWKFGGRSLYMEGIVGVKVLGCEYDW